MTYGQWWILEKAIYYKQSVRVAGSSASAYNDTNSPLLSYLLPFYRNMHAFCSNQQLSNLADTFVQDLPWIFLLYSPWLLLCIAMPMKKMLKYYALYTKSQYRSSYLSTKMWKKQLITTICYALLWLYNMFPLRFSIVFLTTVRPNAASEIKTPESYPRCLLNIFYWTVVFVMGLTVRPGWHAVSGLCL